MRKIMGGIEGTYDVITLQSSWVGQEEDSGDSIL